MPKNNITCIIYEVINNYTHSIYGDITVLINKKSYQPYSSDKSALNYFS